MKKLLLLLAVIGMTFTACTEGGGLGEENNGNPNGQPTHSLTVSLTDIDVDCKGGTKTIEIVSTCSWAAKSSEDWSWMQISSNGGRAGMSTVTLTISKNSALEERRATITICNTTHNLEQTIEVVQGANKPYITLDRRNINANPDGETVTVAVNSNVDYTVTSTADWCRSSISNGDKGYCEFTITIDANTEDNVRSGCIEIKNAEYDCVAKISIEQYYAAQIVFTDFEQCKSDKKFHIGVGPVKTEVDVRVYSNVGFEVVNNSYWITVDKLHTADNLYTIKIKIPTIGLGSPFEFNDYTIKLESVESEYEGVSREIVVRQYHPNEHAGDLVEYGGAKGVVSHMHDSGVVVVSVDEAYLPYCTKHGYCDNKLCYDGYTNAGESYSWDDGMHPAEKWCEDYGRGWCLPNIDDAVSMLNSYSWLNKTLTANGYTIINPEFCYLSSTSFKPDKTHVYVAYNADICFKSTQWYKEDPCHVRAIYTIDYDSTYAMWLE